MTKARDLAGFASSSVTTTASDGLVLKGDGSSTDVVIKNGANATVASVADGTVNIAAAGSITATGASVGALARGSIQVGNSSGVAAPLAKGTSGYVLTAGANDLSWASAGPSYGTSSTAFSILTVNAAGNGYEWIPRKDAMYLPPASLPADWANPTSTYTSSGTWSKGALADDTIVWFYIVGGGSGGGGRSGSANGGAGGAAGVFYGTASYFDGAQYTIGAGGTGGGSGDQMGNAGSGSSIVLSAGSGGATLTTGLVYKTPDAAFLPGSVSSGGIVITSTPPLSYSVTNPGTVGGSGGGYNSGVGGSSVFGAGGGGGMGSSYGAAGTSTYAGNGGSNSDGVAPGGGGGAKAGSGGVGQAGNLRVYVIT